MKILFLLTALIVALLGCTKSSNRTSKPPDIEQNLFDKGIGFQEEFDYVVNDWAYYYTDTVSTTNVKFVALDSPIVFL